MKSELEGREKGGHSDETQGLVKGRKATKRLILRSSWERIQKTIQKRVECGMKSELKKRQKQVFLKGLKARLSQRTKRLYLRSLRDY